MLILLSPAKTLDFESEPATAAHSQPRLVDRSEELIEVLVHKSPDELSELMGISLDLAELNAERFAAWHRPFTPDNARAAVLAFAGDVYAAMDAPATFDEGDFAHAQKRLRILSGLYGVLRPLDLIQPYRLEMGTKLRTERGDDLYDFWGDTVTRLLADDLAATSPKGVVNLASQEYFGAVAPDQLGGRVITPRFLDEKNGTHKVIAFFAKRARGAMAAWLVRERVTTYKAIPDFAGLGYRFDPERSTDDAPVFLRDES